MGRPCSSTSVGTAVADAFDWGLLEPAGESGSAAGDDAVLTALIAVLRKLLGAGRVELCQHIRLRHPLPFL